MIEDLINRLNARLENLLACQRLPLGLYEGEMGLCLYYYFLYKKTGKKAYEKTAETILDDIYKRIGEISSIDVKTGLAGIGLGITLLARHACIRANVNKTLEDMDHCIIRELFYLSHEDARFDSLSFIHLLFYLYIRVTEHRKETASKRIYQELIIRLLNRTYTKLDSQPDHAERSFAYKIDFELPQFLFLLGKLLELNYYNDRIKAIVNELSVTICSIFPILHANRLYLLGGINCINKQIHSPLLSSHSNLLKNHTDINQILNHELKDKNIYLNNGASSLYYLYKSCSSYFNDSVASRFKNKIISSQAWTMLEENELYFENHIGLFTGFTGCLITLSTLNEHNHEK